MVPIYVDNGGLERCKLAAQTVQQLVLDLAHAVACRCLHVLLRQLGDRCGSYGFQFGERRVRQELLVDVELVRVARCEKPTIGVEAI